MILKQWLIVEPLCGQGYAFCVVFASLMAVSVLKFHKSVKPMKKCGLFALKNNRFAVILWH
jgi:hypothetical protein